MSPATSTTSFTYASASWRLKSNIRTLNFDILSCVTGKVSQHSPRSWRFDLRKSNAVRMGSFNLFLYMVFKNVTCENILSTKAVEEGISREVKAKSASSLGVRPSSLILFHHDRKVDRFLGNATFTNLLPINELHPTVLILQGSCSPLWYNPVRKGSGTDSSVKNPGRI